MHIDKDPSSSVNLPSSTTCPSSLLELKDRVSSVRGHIPSNDLNKSLSSRRLSLITKEDDLSSLFK